MQTNNESSNSDDNASTTDEMFYDSTIVASNDVDDDDSDEDFNPQKRAKKATSKSNFSSGGANKPISLDGASDGNVAIVIDIKDLYSVKSSLSVSEFGHQTGKKKSNSQVS